MHFRLCENVAEDGVVEAGNTRGSGDESLEIRRENNNFVDRVIVVVRKLVECEKGSDNDLKVSILLGARGGGGWAVIKFFSVAVYAYTTQYRSATTPK